MTADRPTADELLLAALKELPLKPADSAKQSEKKRWSELLSERVALAFAEELRARGLAEALPAPPGETGTSGAERRMSGGIGAKKVDVTWATPESGLLPGISIKSISFRDTRTKNYQKNLTNRRGDMLFESTTLHRRFPYAVLAGFFFLDSGAASDHTTTRKSTFENAHARFRIFTNRTDPYGRDEQYERFYFILHDSNPFRPSVEISPAGAPDKRVTLSAAFDEILEIVADRNPDFYLYDKGILVRQR